MITVAEALTRIDAHNAETNSFTSVLPERAQTDDARSIPGPLRGVPFAVKNLFDIKGEITLSGSKINRDHPPATEDAAAIQALTNAGAVLVGALNMDEYAYGFTTENSHYGPCRNPHDTTRVAGGSSGGSAAAVAAGLVPLTLGSDTNGSVRVPAALCGVFGFKPTYGRVDRTGMELFAPSFDHVGMFAATLATVRAAWEALVADGTDVPTNIRIAVADNYFARGGAPEVFDAVATAAKALDVTEMVSINDAAKARAAAMVITAAEGAQLHLDDLRTRPGDFDPMTRDRFLAGALVPAAMYLEAQAFREKFRRHVSQLFEAIDVILAPTTPFVAPHIGQREAVIDGETVLTQPYLGVYTQPLSFIGLPVVSVPMEGPDGMPLGVQVIAAPGHDATVLHVAEALEAANVTHVKPWR